MIAFGSDTRVFVATEPVDFRRGVHGLVALVSEGLAGNPYSGDVFVFRSKRADKLRFLIFDGSGMILATKWLEEGRLPGRRSRHLLGDRELTPVEALQQQRPNGGVSNDRRRCSAIIFFKSRSPIGHTSKMQSRWRIDRNGAS
ncbi:IS66 family insertion sequence element accessory protein TnpB [Mesorhizobium sp. M00.F.Ca.ET.217.01.1.1]|nr:IS66 family insertion sequence element accessory protein TnpB [Mesorhizobium sp. M00.F.Ca.ET.217.01.1.1]TGV83793.1 IS66 family insertion sequence element accessory protein TnpB [Mesorhizobium sp. M00.F.Ca.ET.158.01.1.1]